MVVLERVEFREVVVLLEQAVILENLDFQGRVDFRDLQGKQESLDILERVV